MVRWLGGRCDDDASAIQLKYNVLESPPKYNETRQTHKRWNNTWIFLEKCGKSRVIFGRLLRLHKVHSPDIWSCGNGSAVDCFVHLNINTNLKYSTKLFRISSDVKTVIIWKYPNWEWELESNKSIGLIYGKWPVDRMKITWTHPAEYWLRWQQQLGGIHLNGMSCQTTKILSINYPSYNMARKANSTKPYVDCAATIFNWYSIFGFRLLERRTHITNTIIESSNGCMVSIGF